jgi:protein gp37
MDAPAIAMTKGYSSLIPVAMKMRSHVGQHCEHVSPGCEHCYAETNNHRCLPANGTGLPYDRRARDLIEPFIDEKVLLQPLKWREKRWYDPDDGTLAKLEPRKIFVENQSDLFGEWVTDEMLDRIFAVMALSPQHTFQVLTKRPKRMLAYLSDPIVYVRVHRQGCQTPHPSSGPHFIPPLPLLNVWLGVSVENQAAADERIPLLLQTPAAVRFVSCEPLLGPVDLDAYMGWPGDPNLNWVIAGCESGPGVRDVPDDVFRSLRDQCVVAGVPFFLKQMKINGKLLHNPALVGREWREFPIISHSL